MAQDRVIFQISTSFFLDENNKFIKKNSLPLCPININVPEILENDEYISLESCKFRDTQDKILYFFTHKGYPNTFSTFKDYLCFKTNDEIMSSLKEASKTHDYIYFSCEGNIGIHKAILTFSDKYTSGGDTVLDEALEQRSKILKDDNLQDFTLDSFGLPTEKAMVIPEGESHMEKIEDFFHAALVTIDPELNNKTSKRFLYGESTFMQMAEATASLPSDLLRDHFKNMDTFQDILINNISDKKCIVSLTKDHISCNKFWKGKKAVFIDGGTSTVTSAPKFSYHIVRVSDFSVRPGLTEDDGVTPHPERESMSEKAYPTHDIFDDFDIIEKLNEDYDVNEDKRNECSRYIAELHYTWMKSRSKGFDKISGKWQKEDKPDIIFLHGPLQQKFELFCQNHPNYIPGINKKWLEENEITRDKIIKCFGNKFKDDMHWNSPLVIYGFLQKEIAQSDVPIVGCVERSQSSTFTFLYCKNYIDDVDDGKLIVRKAKKYKMQDDKLFGFCLDEGQYVKPVKWASVGDYGETLNQKNQAWRLSDRKYENILNDYPIIQGTMLNCSFKKLPFRVELNLNENLKYTHQEILNLVYHNSLLSDDYIYPVGLNIVDKYAKIPASLSKSISRAYSHKAFGNAVRLDLDEFKESGEWSGRNVSHVSHILSKDSIRDFFYRPKESKINNKKRKL